jgi:hypothetical protein
MAAYMYIKVYAPSLSVADLSAKLAQSSNPQVGMNGIDNLMNAIAGGAIDAQVDVVTNDASTSLPSTSGTGAVSVAYNLK